MLRDSGRRSPGSFNFALSRPALSFFRRLRTSVLYRAPGDSPQRYSRLCFWVPYLRSPTLLFREYLNPILAALALLGGQVGFAIYFLVFLRFF